MENTDSYPVFHTRREAAKRRRAEAVAPEAAFLVLDAAARLLDRAAAVYGDLAVHDIDRPSIPRQLRRSPGAQCPVPGCTHHPEGDDPSRATPD